MYNSLFAKEVYRGNATYCTDYGDTYLEMNPWR